MAGINGVGIAILLAGGALAYSGVKGKSVSTTLREFLAGEMTNTSDTTAPGTDGRTTNVVVSENSGTGATANGAKVVALARSQLGKPYVFNTPTDATLVDPPTFDCSGLTMWAYYQAIGFKLTHYTGTQYPMLSHVPVAQCKPGDLLFYGSSGVTSYHVAINIGGGQLIEAPEPGKSVQVRGWSPGDGDLVSMAGVCP